MAFNHIWPIMLKILTLWSFIEKFTLVLEPLNYLFSRKVSFLLHQMVEVGVGSVMLLVPYSISRNFLTSRDTYLFRAATFTV